MASGRGDIRDVHAIHPDRDAATRGPVTAHSRLTIARRPVSGRCSAAAGRAR